APVELRDAAGRFAARGYGHPGTLIAFRVLSRDEAEAEPMGAEGVLRRVRAAAALRRSLNLGAYSHRLVYGEADALPGLIVDRYRLETPPGDPPAQVFVAQAHTAGAERLLAGLPAVLAQLTEEEAAGGAAASGGLPGWAHSALLVRDDVRSRALEGLAEKGTRLLRECPEASEARLADLRIRVAGPGDAPLALAVNLSGGQKTGFFLDQSANVRLAARLAGNRLALSRAGGIPAGTAPVRVLDLFSYVGQWGAQLAAELATRGLAARVSLLDSSAAALEFAARNVSAQGAEAEPIRGDAMEMLTRLPAAGYDVVVCDPPAFIKSRKDAPTGEAAYVKLNAQALRLVAPGGLLVSCSCSSLLAEADFAAVLARAAEKAGRPEPAVRWVARGGPAPDHPLLAGFPEGHYLKCWVGVVA
ncbi:MAG: methyltransferase domain-containing protein, partial [Deltaproteobacteria bacterium]|nr:methyltransferase domain-containing protein [Deltaproteobacteria bacterium]